MNVVLVVAGASRGFTVLLLGGVVQPWVGLLYAPLGYVWLAIVAVGAFAVAALPRKDSRVPVGAVRSERAATGAAAALGSYLLVLPIVAWAAAGVPVAQALGTSLTAVTVGSVVGLFAPTDG